MNVKFLVLGGSKGLGQAIANQLGEGGIVVSRSKGVEIDLSESKSFSRVKSLITNNSFETIIYCAGGGPHGEFFSKPLHAHKWAFEVNFLRPIEIAYYLKSINYKGLFIYIGSAIAERSSSLKSLSYSNSKKMALKVLLSLKEEELRVRVFSPPYMNTDLLPLKSWPRLEASELVLEPKQVAQTLLNWMSADFSQSGSFDPRHFDWIDRFSYSFPEGKEV